MKHLEVLVEKWQFGKNNTVLCRGQRFFEEDDEAARIWEGMGLVKTVEQEPRRVEARVMTTDTTDALLEPRGAKQGRYGRRDLRARD